MSHIISFSDAVTLVGGFIRELRAHAVHVSLGGTISKEAIDGGESLIKANRPYTGNMGWFCLNRENNNYPKLFMAFEKNNDYQRGTMVNAPAKNTLICPDKNSTFTFNTAGNTEEFLRSHSTSAQNMVDKRITKQEVINFKENFRSHELFSLLNLRPYGFFENDGQMEGDVMKFLLQPNLKYIRYYFGYDKAERYKEGRIRVILVGVDENGKNLVPGGSPQFIARKNVILQKSWPPPTSTD